MVVADPIADMLTRIRNAQMAQRALVSMPASKMRISLARILKEEGYIEEFDVVADNPQGSLRLRLKYLPDRTPAISGLERVSRPGRRVYSDAGSIPRVLSGMGVAILSTSRGVVSDRQARRMRVGGEVLCYVW